MQVKPHLFILAVLIFWSVKSMAHYESGYESTNLQKHTTNVYENCRTNRIDSISESADDTLRSPQSITLTLTPINSGSVRLNWSAVPGAVNYEVLRDDGSGQQVIATTGNLEYVDVVFNCDLINYSYQIISGAESSNLQFADLQNPGPSTDPIMSYVTIENGIVVVYWNPHPDADIDHYRVRWSIDFSGNTFPDENYLETLSTEVSLPMDGIADPSYNPCQIRVKYAVLAYDNCQSPSPGENMGKPHIPILLTGETDSNCGRKAKLSWTAYVGMNPQVFEYIVERSVDGDPFEVIDEITVTDVTLPNYDYTDDEFLPAGKEVRYRVAAINGSGATALKSYSCIISLQSDVQDVVYFDTENVSVTEENTIEITASADPADLPDSVAIYRKSPDAVQYELLQTLEWNSSGEIIFIDENAQPEGQSYLYEARLLDACGNELAISESFNSLYLQVFTEDKEVLLGWNQHEGWGSEFIGYEVYRYHDGVLMDGYPQDINSISFRETSPSEDIINITYRVAAKKADGTLSWSNEVILPREARIDIPNAFRPGSANPGFKPIISNIDPTTYAMQIFNRFGQMIFETNVPTHAWDGSYNGKIQQGVYIYQITFRDQAGSHTTKRGVVLLMQ